MRMKVLLLAVAVVSSVVVSSLVQSKAESSTSQGFDKLVLEVRSDKKSYLPGEPINLKFKVVNHTEEDIPLSPGSDVETGRLQVFIAAGGGEYLRYVGPRWGLSDVAYPKPLLLNKKGRESFETEAVVLWNQQVPTSHLNERAAKRAAKGRIPSAYALLAAGEYRIKAVLADHKTGQRIESEAIEITVEEVAGDDLLVWNAIKNDGRYARFLHNGELKEHPESPAAREFIDNLERIAALHPNSRYAAHINRNLEKYKKHLEKWKERINRNQ